MSGGAGITDWARKASRNNRQLLKGGGGYKNFDKSYITDYIISRKPLVFKEATPEQLANFRRRLIKLRKNEIRRKIKAMIISVTIVGLLVYWVFG